MGKWKIHTPDGVQDQLFESCYYKRKLETDFRSYFCSCGYKEIETPVMEFYDIYLSENKMVDQESLFKFTDHRGRILALRSDMTVPTARVVSTKMRDHTRPLQCFYIGDCFRMNEMGGGRQKEFTQAGVEIIGASSPKADAQVLATAVEAVLSTGLTDFQIDVGQVEFFKGLMEEAGVDGDEMEMIRHLINSKDFVGLEKRLNQSEIKEDIKKLILSLPGQFGSVDMIDRIESIGINKRSKAALDNLRQIITLVEDYGYGKYISVDLGMVQSIDYYTGLIFKGYTYGIGFPILGGGRYDKLLKEFGAGEPATGFSIGINMLISAMENQKKTLKAPGIDIFVIYEEKARKKAFELCRTLRSQNKGVLLDVNDLSEEEALAYCGENGISSLGKVDIDHNISFEEMVTSEGGCL